MKEKITFRWKKFSISMSQDLIVSVKIIYFLKMWKVFLQNVLFKSRLGHSDTQNILVLVLCFLSFYLRSCL